MKISDEMNKIKSHMTMFFSRIIFTRCKLSEMMDIAKVSFCASKKDGGRMKLFYYDISPYN